MLFEKRLQKYKEMIDQRLESEFSPVDCKQRSVYDAMAYSVLADGKRLRPVLTLAACDMLDGDIDDALSIAVAIECIHTYSLIHDDLPCMDDDDMRRGRPTCHKKFNEATALLAGDGLLTYAFECLTNMDNYTSITADRVLKISTTIAKCAGCDGMIGGQVVDLENEGKADVDESTLSYLHERKTGALIRAAAVSGGICADADKEELDALTCFAESLGLAFQIQDDILDVTGDATILGKPIGSDEENDKTTFVTLFGIEKARKMADELTNRAISSLDCFGEKAEFLRNLADSLINRQK